MKGFKDKSGKFRPTENKNGVRKSRDQSTKTQGVKLGTQRKQREVSLQRLPDVDIRKHYWGFHTNDGHITELQLGNLSDAGFYWSGNKESINHFIVMMAGFKDTNEFANAMREEGVTLEMLRPQMLKNLSGKLVDDETDDGLYAMSGGDTVWKFGDIPEIDLKGNIDGWDYFGNGKYFTKEEKDAIEDEFYNHYSNFGYEDFLREYGEKYRDKLRKMINESNDLGDLLDEIRSDDNIYDRFEIYDQLQNPKINEALHETIEELQKEGKVRKK